MQVEALEEKMSHMKGELAAKEEQLTQVIVYPIPVKDKIRHPPVTNNDLMVVTTNYHLHSSFPFKNGHSIFL